MKLNELTSDGCDLGRDKPWCCDQAEYWLRGVYDAKEWHLKPGAFEPTSTPYKPVWCVPYVDGDDGTEYLLAHGMKFCPWCRAELPDLD